MRRVVIVVALVIALGGLAALGADLAIHKTVHADVLKWGSGFSAFGLLVAALMTDPKSVIAFVERLARIKRGRESETTEGDLSGGDSRRSEDNWV